MHAQDGAFHLVPNVRIHFQPVVIGQMLGTLRVNLGSRDSLGFKGRRGHGLIIDAQQSAALLRCRLDKRLAILLQVSLRVTWGKFSLKKRKHLGHGSYLAAGTVCSKVGPGAAE